MTTEEIKQIFDTVSNDSSNMLDSYMALSTYKQSYEESEFYKVTKLSIYEAYGDYYHSALRIQSLIQEIQKVLDGIDYSELEKSLDLSSLFNQIPEEYKDYFKTIIEANGNI